MKNKNTDSELTEREWQIIKMCALGMRAKEISEKINLSVFTVRSHIRNAYEKTGCRNIAHVLYKILTTKEASAVQSFCETNQCEIIQWIDPAKIADFTQAERCILQYETATLEAIHIGGGVFIGNGQIVPKPQKVARYPKGFRSSVEAARV